MRSWIGKSCAVGIVTGFLFTPTICAADEVVTFPSARYLVGELTQRLARERVEPVKRAPVEMIKGYLSRPAGTGPFAAVVHLHGCGGLLEQRRTSAEKQFTDWGYVTLIVDSFATRGIKEACADGPIPSRQADAMGALIYLSKLAFVDPKRVAVVGYSQGGMAALEVASVQPVALFDMPVNLKYKATVAYYPICSAAADELEVPTLILTGELDDWSPAADCRRMMKRQDGKGTMPKLIIFPEAYHSFDSPSAGIYGIRHFGHWLRYNAEATAQAAAEMRKFLAVQLAN